MADIEVKGVLESNTTLSGTFTTPDGVVLNEGDYVLAIAQSSAVQNGIWIAHSGGAAWTRPVEGIDYRKGFEVRVLEGSNNNLALWIQNNSGVPGTSATTFQKESIGRIYTGGSGISIVGSTVSIAPSGVAEGTYENALIQVGADGRLVFAASSDIGSTFIEGLAFEYVSATQVQMKIGSAYIPGIGRIIRVGSPITTTVISGANAISYLYLHEVNGAGQLEVSATAPDTPYVQQSAVKTGDDTRRFLGMLRNDSAGNLIPFRFEVLAGNIYRLTYELGDNNTEMRVVNAFTGATTRQSTVIGPGSATAALRLVGPNAISAFIYWVTTGTGAKNIGYTPTAGTPPVLLGAAFSGREWIDLGNGQELYYQLTTSTDTISLYVRGFVGRR